MKKLSLTFMAVCLVTTGFAQDITGAWYGQLAIAGLKLPLIFHITKAGDTYTSTLDSPGQSAAGMATSATTFVANRLTVIAAKYDLKYTGSYKADSAQIAGTLKQGARELPLVLSRKSFEPPKIRPQDPVEFPYSREEVSFTNPKAGCTLAGTLSMPKDRRAKEIAVLIAGTGPEDRNEDLSIFNHRPFLVLSDWLTRQGIGVLRYNKRGVGKSTGSFDAATTADFADDAEAAVAYIQLRKDLKGLPIGLVGHSEGGLIATMIAARNSSIAFVVLLAGPGVPITQVMLKQNDDVNRLRGVDPQVSLSYHQVTRNIYYFLNTNRQLSTEQAKVGLVTLIDSNIKRFSRSDMEKKEFQGSFISQIQFLLSPWFRYFIAMDPGATLEKVRCPLLALNGSLDSQVNAEENLSAIRTHLVAGGNKNVTVLAMEGMNHLFQKATTGSFQEYGQIEETMSPLALKTVSDWINRL